MKKVSIGVIILLVLVSLWFVFKPNKDDVSFNQNPINQNPPKNMELDFCLFNVLPMESESINKLLQTKVGTIDKEKYYSEGYNFSFIDMVKDVDIKKPGFLKINEDEIVYDEITSFHLMKNATNDDEYIEFVGENEKNEEENSLIRNYYIIDVDKDFLKQNSVKLNKLVECTDPDLASKIIDKSVDFLQTDPNGQDMPFVSEYDNDPDGLLQEITNNYGLKLLTINDFPKEKFLIAVFEPKKDEVGAESFSVFLVNGEVEQCGYYSNYVSFSINDKWYLGYYNQVILYSGYWGKMLVSFEDNKLELVKSDYSFAD